MHLRVGRALQRARLTRRLTQSQVAEATNLSLKYVGEIERGEANPTLDTLEAIAIVVDLDAADAVGEPRESVIERVRVLLKDDANRRIERLQEHVAWLEAIAPARQLAARRALETPRSTIRRRVAARQQAKGSAMRTERGAR